MKKGKRIIFILLAVLLLFECYSFGARSRNKEIEELKQQLALEQEKAFHSNEEIVQSANDSASIWETAQRMVGDDIILYRDSFGNFTYIPVNKDLPLSDYDWDHLERLLKSHKEMEYRVDGKTVSIKGIDVSSYQGDIDWESVAKDDVKFAIIRLGYRGYSSGKLTLDDHFEANISGARKNGIAVGVYFVTQAVSVTEAKEEAQFVLDAIAPYKVTWPVVLDLEASGGSNPRTKDLTAEARTDCAIAFCDTISMNGYTPMLYSNIGWFINQLELDRLTQYDKWFAQYFNRPFFPYAFQMWQYTSEGRVRGIKGNVDLNLAMFDYSTGQPVPYQETQKEKGE